jgi:hypothetical protein
MTMVGRLHRLCRQTRRRIAVVRVVFGDRAKCPGIATSVFPLSSEDASEMTRTVEYTIPIGRRYRQTRRARRLSVR